jgi:hypothetical protein
VLAELFTVVGLSAAGFWLLPHAVIVTVLSRAAATNAGVPRRPVRITPFVRIAMQHPRSRHRLETVGLTIYGWLLR